MPESEDYRHASGGLIGGLSAFIVGYALTYIAAGDDMESRLEPIDTVLELFQIEPIGTWRVIGWMFYNAHFVDTSVTAEFGPFETTMTFNLVSEAAGSLELLYLVPPVLLFLSGFIITYYFEMTDYTEIGPPILGVTISYLLLMALGILVFAYDDVYPEPLLAIVLGGVIYPLIFSGLGGVIGSSVRSSQTQ